MAFHWRHGWYFERKAGGDVRIFHVPPLAKIEAEADQEIIIDPDSWCSIVASVSAKGETARTLWEARYLHNEVT